MSNKIYFGEKVLIDCLCNGNKVKQLNIMLPKTSAYVKIYDGQAKWMDLLIEFVKNTLLGKSFRVLQLPTQLSSLSKNG